MDRVTLTARLTLEGGVYCAKVDQLPIEANGISIDRTRGELTDLVRSWISAQDTTDSLESALAAAGFPGVTEDTEIELEFVE